MLLGLFALVLGGLYRFGALSFSNRGDQRRALARRGQVAVVSSRPWTVSANGTRLKAVSPVGALGRALAGSRHARVAPALRRAGFDALLIDPQDRPAWARASSSAAVLSDFRTLDGLVGRYLSVDMALYAPDPVAAIPASHRDALAVVARRVLAGERLPHVESFPPGLRAVEHVEVMVLLRSGPRPRLWRSARGSSIARAFLTAVRVARTRWHERKQAMGGPLAELLPRLHVEVSLLQDDGELGTRSATFIDRVVRDHHGVAYDHKGAWRYLLPDATREQGDGRPSVALSQLLVDHGLAPDAFQRPDVRPYRLRVQRLAVSPPTKTEADPLAPPESPQEVLDAARP